MKKTIILFAIIIATLTAGRTVMAQGQSIFSESVWSPTDGEQTRTNVNLLQTAVEAAKLKGKAAAHSISLKEIKEKLISFKEKMEALEEQENEMQKKDAEAAKKIKAQIRKTEKRIEEVENSIEEVEKVEGDSAIAKRIKEVLEEETKSKFADLTDNLAQTIIGVKELKTRINNLQTDVSDHERRILKLEDAIDGEQGLKKVKQDKLFFGLSNGGWISRPGAGFGVGPTLLIPMSDKTDLELKAMFGASGDGMGYLVQFGWDYRVNSVFGLKLALSHIGDAGNLKNGLKSSTIGVGPGISFSLHQIVIIFIDTMVGAGGKRGGGVQFDAGGALGFNFLF